MACGDRGLHPVLSVRLEPDFLEKTVDDKLFFCGMHHSGSDGSPICMGGVSERQRAAPAVADPSCGEPLRPDLCPVFALPFDDTYRKEAAGGRVCRSGLYGYCRHPGILAFFFCFLFLGLAAGERQLAAGMFYSGLNLLYAWYQDRIIFTREFSDYGEYRRDVPFLFPVRGKARQ